MEAINNASKIIPKVSYSWFDDMINKNNVKRIPVGGKLLQYIISVVVVVYLFFLFYTISNDNKALDENYLAYMFALILPMTFMFLVILSNSRSSNVIMIGVACTLVLIGFFVFSYFPNAANVGRQVYYSLFDFNKIPGFDEETSFLVTIVLKIILVLIVIIGLSLVYNLFVNQSYRQEGIFGFFIYLIFFIPCMFSDFIQFVFKEFNATPNIILVLFVLEILFLLLYFYLPKTILKKAFSKGKNVVRDPLFLGKEQILGGYELLKKDDEELDKLLKSRRLQMDENSTIEVINRNYCLSFWFSYNPTNVQSIDAFPTRLFRYGNTNEDDVVDLDELLGVPMMTYLNDDIFHFVFTNEIIITKPDDLEQPENLDEANAIIEDTKETLLEKFKKISTEVHIPPQRWNNIVFNYHNNRVDLFINGILERTIEFKQATPVYKLTHSFVVGSKENNLHSAICNFNIFSEPLNESQITQSYNLLKTQNPPVNNLL